MPSAHSQTRHQVSRIGSGDGHRLVERLGKQQCVWVHAQDYRQGHEIININPPDAGLDLLYSARGNFVPDAPKPLLKLPQGDIPPQTLQVPSDGLAGWANVMSSQPLSAMYHIRNDTRYIDNKRNWQLCI